MSAGVLERAPTEPVGSAGQLAARRAVVRWAWRLFRREWRQQILVLALIVVAVAATIVGSTVANNQPPPANAGFGSAQDALTEPGNDPSLSSQITALERFGQVDVIENETESVPGSVDTFQLRAQNPHGPYAAAMLALVSGRYPRSADEVAVTAGVATDFDLRIGGKWRLGAVTRRVVGIVENPQSLLDEFALVVPGQVTAPTQTTVLFDAPDVSPASIGPNVTTPGLVAQHNALNPETISLAVLVIGMILIALVAVGGFTVLAQRRLRSLGMLASLGATDGNVSLVVRANGVIVGAVGAALGFVLGLVVWFAYRPHLEQSAHHVIAMFALPWLVVALAVVLAIVATYYAASRPARAITRIPIVAALSGRPPPPRQIRRSVVPGVVLLVIAFLLLGYSGGTNNGNGSGGTPELLLGLLVLIPGVILLAPFALSVLAGIGRRMPVSVRLALRDLARYRARSGSALAAISIGVMIAVIIATLAAARYGNVLDYAGPNLAANQLIVYTPNEGVGPSGQQAAPPPDQLRSLTKTVDSIGSSMGALVVVPLEQANVNVNHNAPGRQFTGPIYVATPQMLKAFGIAPSAVNSNADLLTSRPGLSGVSGLSLGACVRVGPARGSLNGGRITVSTCTKGTSIADPVIEEVGALPTGTSAPNTVITEHALRTLQAGGTAAVQGWLLQTSQPITGAQIHSAQTAAQAAGMTVESKNDQPTSSQVINWATVFGIALALCVLAMSVGLIRSETAGDLRTLAATGASSITRRTLTAATAGGLALLGAVLGTFAGYVGVIGWLRSNSLNGGIGALGNVPGTNLLVILIGMPVLAIVVGWLLAGREPPAIAHQPIE